MPYLGAPVLLLSVLFLSVLGVRITVDDTNPAWTYSSPWNAITPSSPCNGCLTQPDPAQALNHTWHDTAFINTAQLTFTGVSIEVYTICARAYYGMNFSFTLDSGHDGVFVRPEPCAKNTFNYLVYARTNLSLGHHIFVIANGRLNGVANTSNLLLDYAIYDDGTQSSVSSASSSFPLFAIVVPSAVAALLLVVNIAIFFWNSRRKQLHKKMIRDVPLEQEVLVPDHLETQRSLLVASPVMSERTPSSYMGLSDPYSPTMSQFSSFGYTGAPIITTPGPIFQGNNSVAVAVDSETILEEEVPYLPASAPTLSSSRLPDEKDTGDGILAGPSISTFQQPGPSSTWTWTQDVKAPIDPDDTPPPPWRPPSYQGHWEPGT